MKFKIVINSNAHYKLALNVLLASILRSDLDDYLDLIISISESEFNSPPEILKISDFTDICSDKEVVVVRNTINNYDCGGFNNLYLYQDHKLIKSKYYFYLLDTSSVGPNFHNKIKTCIKRWGNYNLIKPMRAAANTMIFNHKLISKYGDSFNREFSKQEAVKVEHDLNFIHHDGTEINGFTKLVNTMYLPERIYLCDVDVYNMGYPRKQFYYEYFDVHKYVLWDLDGDFKGNVTENGQCF